MYYRRLVLGLVFVLLYFFVLTGVSSAAQPASGGTPSTATAQEDPLKGKSAQESTDSGSMQKSPYILPYPGILPDHPLYFLKKVRDSVIEMLIADQVRKSEFYLLQADKHLNAGVFLYEKENKDLSKTTIVLSSDFMKRSVDGLVALKAGGREIPAAVIEKLEQATGKHLEVLADLSGKSEGTVKEGLESSLQTVTSLRGELPKLK